MDTQSPAVDQPSAPERPPYPDGRTSLRRRLSTLAIIVVTGAIIFVVAFVANQPPATTANGSVTAITLTAVGTGEPPTVGKPAPDFTAATTDGTKVTLSSLKGHPVWLTFGATWCQPCRAENPDIEAAYQKYKDQGLLVVQVYITEDVKTVTDYTDRVGLTYTKVPDPNQVLAAEYRILGIPSHFFIDKNGIIKQLRIGSFDAPGIEAALKGILQ